MPGPGGSGSAATSAGVSGVAAGGIGRGSENGVRISGLVGNASM